MKKSDRIVTLLYLKNKFRLWRNISLFFAFITLLLLVNFMFGDTSIPGRDHIASIKISGIIFEDDYRSGVLEKLATNSKTKAVLVTINSPGGGIVGSEILYNNLREISKNKPVVIMMESLAASGGYMAAVAGDYIIAHNGTLTGSIGVLMESAEVTELAKKLGVNLRSYKSSPVKGYPSPLEKFDPVADRLIMGSIRDSYEFFAGLVYERRKDKMDPKKLKSILDGRVFTGRQALQSGLIDEIGGKAEALNYLKTATKLDTDNLPIKEVSLDKNDSGLLDQIFNLFPNLFSKTREAGIMAIMK